MTTPRNERGAWVLEAYASEYYPGAEDTSDPDGAYTVAGDVIADILHHLKSIGREDPERVLDLATAHFVEEQDDPSGLPPLGGESPNIPAYGTGE